MLIRDATPGDAAQMAEVLNEIIAIGGTTAHQKPLGAADLIAHYIAGPGVATCVLAEEAGQVIGWQSVGLWKGDQHIGSFVRVGLQAKGTGAALFAATLRRARARGLTRIVASIRADNIPGLAFYDRIGFSQFAVEPDFALEDGRVVGRVHRQYEL